MSTIPSDFALSQTYEPALRTVYWCVAGISLSLDAFLLFVILRKTPKAMGSYKFYLLNIVFWGTVYDVQILLLFQPMPLFPVPGFCTLGLARHFGWTFGAHAQFPIFCICLGACGVAVGNAFVHRYNLLKGKRPKHTAARLVRAFLTHLLSASPTALGFWFTFGQLGQDFGSVGVTYPKVLEYIQGRSCFIFDKNSLIAKITFYFSLLRLVLNFAMASGVYVRTKRILVSQKWQMSRKTYEMHKQLTLSLLAQLTIPVGTLVFPFVALVPVALFDVGPSSYLPSVVCFPISTLHSSLNAVMMLTLITPYRRFLLHLVRTSLPWVRRRVSGPVTHTVSSSFDPSKQHMA